jgi:hypothetical protein
MRLQEACRDSKEEQGGIRVQQSEELKSMHAQASQGAVDQQPWVTLVQRRQ